MTNLMKNLKAMKKAEEEVKSVVKKKGFVDEEYLPRLQHLKAVVKETMRFQPMAEIISRETTEKCIINGYEIPAAETPVFVNMYVENKKGHTQVWDLNKFPRDFMNPSSNVELGRQNFELIPFGARRRICPYSIAHC